MKAGDKCLICNRGTFVAYDEEFVVRYMDKTKTLDVTILCCTKTPDKDHEDAHSFYTPESERLIDVTFADMKREHRGLLTSTELKDLRAKNHNMTQSVLAKLLGEEVVTIKRYESGVIIQSKEIDDKLREILC